MIVYIAGKITGNENYRDQFSAAEQKLTTEGRIVLNPALLPGNMPNNKALSICMAMIEQADAIYMIKGWENSMGARTEWMYAQYLGKEVIEE